MNYKYEPGKSKYLDAIVSHRKHQLTKYSGPKTVSWRLKLCRLKLVMEARKVLWKLSNLKKWIYGKLQKM